MKALNSPKEKELRRVGTFSFTELPATVPVTGGFPRLWLSSKIFLKTHCLSTTCLPGYEPQGGHTGALIPKQSATYWPATMATRAEPRLLDSTGRRVIDSLLHNSPSCQCCILTPQHTEQKRAPESSMLGFITKGAPRCQLRCSLELHWSVAFLWREWCWSWNSSTLATSCKELIHWKRF